MSSYYVDSLLCKSAPGSSLFPIVERASCGIGPGGENSRTAAVTFTPSLPGVYSVSNAAYQSLNPVFISGCGLGRDIHTQDCSSPLDQGRLFSGSCCHPGPGPLTSPPDKQYRMYPWMRASGKFWPQTTMTLKKQYLRRTLAVRLISTRSFLSHGKNRKTFIAQLMSSAAINSFDQSSRVFTIGRDLPLGVFSSALLLLLQPLLPLCGCKRVRSVA